MIVPKKPVGVEPGEDDQLFASLDPQTLAFLKDYLSISDEDLKAHVRRLVEEIRLNPKKKP
jgi:hypothetical protein